jgi:hypothetical protein
VSASRGISVTPTPAATSACEAIVSSASKATRGSNPAWRHTSSVMRRQPLAIVEAIQGSSARSLSESLRRSVSAWSAGRITSYVSSTSAVSSRSVARVPGTASWS